MKNISITVMFESRQAALISLELIDFAVARQNKPDSWSWPEYAVTKAHTHLFQKSLRAQLEHNDRDCTLEADLFDWSLLNGELLRAHLAHANASTTALGPAPGPAPAVTAFAEAEAVLRGHYLDLYKLITSAMMRNKQARCLLAVQDEVERARSRVREARERLQDEELELLEAEARLHRTVLGEEEGCQQ